MTLPTTRPPQAAGPMGGPASLPGKRLADLPRQQLQQRLHQCCADDDLAAAQALLDADASLVNAVDAETEQTPLHVVTT
jgi:hypothetical protein